MKMQKKGKYVNLLASALVAGQLLIGCTSGRLMKRYEEKKDVQNLEVRLTPFQNYSPKSQLKEIKINDEMLDTYIKDAYSLKELDLLIMNSHAVSNIEEDPLKTTHIGDYNKFKSEIIKVSNELGYSEDKLSNLSIHDAIMLSGKIVAHKLDYYHEMISKEQEEIFSSFEDNPIALMAILMANSFDGNDMRNEEAKRVDSATHDQIFLDGKAICRNYAGVNSAVFQVLKDMNPNLKNTYMRRYDPEGLGHLLALPHAWNQVSTINRDKNNLEILITYVDPTWLDTRNRTVADTGEKLQEVNEEDIYNGLDESHFGLDTLNAQVYVADLYETLKDYTRCDEFVSIDFKTSADILEYYGQKEFEQRIKICDKILNICKSNPEKYEKIDFYFLNSFQKSIENLVKLSVGIFLKYGIDGFVDYKKDTNKFDELKKLYERTSNLFPNFGESVLSYENFDYPDEPDYMGEIKIESKEIKLKDIFDRIELEYSK